MIHSKNQMIRSMKSYQMGGSSDDSCMEEKLKLLNNLSLKIEEERERKIEFFKNKTNENSTKSNLGE